MQIYVTKFSETLSKKRTQPRDIQFCIFENIHLIFMTLDWMYVWSFFIFYIPMQGSFFARAWFSYKWENHQNCRSFKLGISDSNLTCDLIFENGFKWCFDWWMNKVNPTIILEVTEGWSSFSYWHLAPQITRLSRIPSYSFSLFEKLFPIKYRTMERWMWFMCFGSVRILL